MSAAFPLQIRDNENEAAQCANTKRPLTHSSDATREGLAVQATTHTSPERHGRLIFTRAGSGCWLWAGYADSNGYGRLYDPERKQIIWAHRYAYEQAHGPILPGHEIDHECQTILCVNATHLAMVTRPEHIRRTMQRLGKDDLHLAAAQMRHLGLTYVEIADALGYACRESAHAAVQAAIAKGLITPNEVPPTPRLTDAQRADIRALYAMGIPQPVIAEHYGVDDSHVSRICSGRRRGGQP